MPSKRLAQRCEQHIHLQVLKDRRDVPDQATGSGLCLLSASLLTLLNSPLEGVPSFEEPKSAVLTFRGSGLVLRLPCDASMDLKEGCCGGQAAHCWPSAASQGHDTRCTLNYVC